MTVHVALSQVTKATLSQNLFTNASFQLEDRDKVAIIGPNGSGKSTFLKIMAGIVVPDSGTVVRGRSTKITYVEQDLTYQDERSVLQEVVKAAKAAGIDADSAEVQAYVILDKIGFRDFDACVTTLSGGWKKRLQLACALVIDIDVLLLDEPTNHLDFEGVAWLEEFLRDAPFAWVAVTHDRFFLNRTSKKIVEICDIYESGILEMTGDYDTFQKRREEYLTTQINTKNALTSKLRIEEAWLNRGAQARTTKAKYRIAQSKELYSKLSEITDRLKQGRSFIKFSEAGKQSKELVELSGVTKEYDGRKIIDNLNLVVRRREIIGVLGDNGTGKTTLLKMIGGLLAPDSGTAKQSDNLEVLYFDQVRQSLQSDIPLKRFLTDYGDRVLYQDQSIHINSWIRRFRFTMDHLEVPINRLSGGEKAKALIAKLIQRKADLLLLDEPTNDLDIATLELLEESLLEFQGAVVIVTHDRYMLERIADYFVGFTSDGKLQFYADISQWLGEIKNIKSTPSDKKAGPIKKIEQQSKPRTGRLSYMEMREFNAMESTIMEKEMHLEQLKQEADELSKAGKAFKLKDVCDALDHAQKEIESLYLRWSELENKQQ